MKIEKSSNLIKIAEEIESVRMTDTTSRPLDLDLNIASYQNEHHGSLYDAIKTSLKNLIETLTEKEVKRIAIVTEPQMSSYYKIKIVPK